MAATRRTVKPVPINCKKSTQIPYRFRSHLPPNKEEYICAATCSSMHGPVWQCLYAATARTWRQHMSRTLASQKDPWTPPWYMDSGHMVMVSCSLRQFGPSLLPCARACPCPCLGFVLFSCEAGIARHGASSECAAAALPAASRVLLRHNNFVAMLAC